MKDKILMLQKRRMQEFLDLYCEVGTHLDDKGVVGGVCRPVDADRVLTFMNETTAQVLEIIEKDAKEV